MPTHTPWSAIVKRTTNIDTIALFDVDRGTLHMIPYVLLIFYIGRFDVIAILVIDNFRGGMKLVQLPYMEIFMYQYLQNEKNNNQRSYRIS